MTAYLRISGKVDRVEASRTRTSWTCIMRACVASGAWAAGLAIHAVVVRNVIRARREMKRTDAIGPFAHIGLDGDFDQILSPGTDAKSLWGRRARTLRWLVMRPLYRLVLDK